MMLRLIITTEHKLINTSHYNTSFAIFLLSSPLVITLPLYRNNSSYYCSLSVISCH